MWSDFDPTPDGTVVTLPPTKIARVAIGKVQGLEHPIVIYYFICQIGLVDGVMMRAHRDRRPNVIKWYILAMSATTLSFVGDCSPHPLISTLSSVLSLLVNTFGRYFLVMKVDKDADQRDVQNGYKLLVATGTSGVQRFTLFITRLEFSAFVVSAALMLLQKAVLKVIIPVYKRCFGNDKRKLWSYPLPALVLSGRFRSDGVSRSSTY